ncbi:hypothetical protein PHLCEN_2v7597 [Hermanssonia centrifuga]|uniref:Glycosyl hydrolase family 95 catalytic domain-containing protein n=1 Tax=Hermanssonia centrifuga TaxID=98765 RepID=A0A2R6NW33_9APHY|nr:hypothetical protein PHLCEN_2v7597 [Hermanssonia centrifuga]
MAYKLFARASAIGPSANVTCSPEETGNATLIVTGATEAWITWVGDTEYDMDAGDVTHSFSFRKIISDSRLLGILNTASPSSASPSTYSSLLSAHINSYNSFLGSFSLSLGQTPDSSQSTDELKAAYQTDKGNPYLEWVLFNYGRYLLTGSAPGVLPANLQGKWASDTSNPWSADSNINIQMNYWFAEMTNMDLVTPLFDYIEVSAFFSF